MADTSRDRFVRRTLLLALAGSCTLWALSHVPTTAALEISEQTYPIAELGLSQGNAASSEAAGLAALGSLAVRTGQCDVLFGNVTAVSGLPAGAAQPFCACDGVDFAPPAYTDGDIERLSRMELTNPFAPLASSPYDHPEEVEMLLGAVCGVVVDPANPERYRLETFGSEAAALAVGAQITHEGQCGACSSLENLAVYMANDDLTGPVRACTLRSFFASEEETIACIQESGFDYACAQMWYFNSRNTRAACLSECALNVNATYHQADGALNACLTCDEAESGPIFAAVAGRTRRNSGLPSSLARPCDQVAQVVHRY